MNIGVLARTRCGEKLLRMPCLIAGMQEYPSGRYFAGEGLWKRQKPLAEAQRLAFAPWDQAARLSDGGLHKSKHRCRSNEAGKIPPIAVGNGMRVALERPRRKRNSFLKNSTNLELLEKAHGKNCVCALSRTHRRLSQGPVRATMIATRKNSS